MLAASRSFSRCVSAAQKAWAGTVAVCFTDPAFTNEQRSDDADGVERLHVVAEMPEELARELGTAKQEVGDGDDPEYSYKAGQRGELFQYRLVGVHKIVSGTSCAFPLPSLGNWTYAEVLQHLESSGARQQWTVFDVRDSSSVSVYTMKNGKGLMISSNYDSLDG